MQNNNYNCNEVTQSFIQYFYSSWLNEPQQLIHTIINEKTKLKYNEIIYEYTNIISLLNEIKTIGLEIIISKYEVIDSKSRQLYILVKGIIKNFQTTNIFTQSFVLIKNGKGNDKWKLINSILIIDKN